MLLLIKHCCNMNWIDDCLTNYYKWLKDNTTHSLDEVTGWGVITTPFVGVFNDMIEIYCKKEGDTILLSDDGATLQNLQLAGVSLTRSQNRREMMASVLRNYGITLSNDTELTTKATMDTFAQKKHNMLAALIELSEFETLAETATVPYFKEEVRDYFDQQGLVFTPQFIAKGKTGLDFSFDFQIAHRKSELVIKSFNTLSKSNISSFLFGWDDVRVIRRETSKKDLLGVAIVNDVDGALKPELLSALENREAQVLLWSQRDEFINRLREEVA